ncbi:alpha/beta fold hydrolase [Actinopolyspora halophila]|uniref:alpha/beta fold hydrolase n=1 Tax=Actinopolyspora halophila TaxID=1850 RepID=UPI0003A5EBDA|nr:alpha/beta fold hydrolase [Actinopolyspora halophila]
MLPSRRHAPSFTLLSVVLITLIVAGTALWSSDDESVRQPSRISARHAQIDVLDGPQRQQRVQLDLTLFTPSSTPAPAVVLAHGFTGDGSDLAGPARRLAARGFTVLTYSARGFGDSTGKIALNSPDYEVADARQLLDWMARQPEIATQSEEDPLVGVGGISYGGALSMLLAGNDPRVDAIAPMATYNDLSEAMLPNAASQNPIPASTPAAHGAEGAAGVFKNLWARKLFEMATGAPNSESTSPPSTTSSSSTAPPPSTTPGDEPLTCENFVEQLCRAYTELARTGQAGERTSRMLAAASPSTVTDNIDVPTLLVQRQNDALFGLEQADANARQITAAGGAVKMLWVDERADRGFSPSVWERVGDWFSHQLHEPGESRGPRPTSSFSYQLAEDTDGDSETQRSTLVAGRYPGLEEESVPRFALPLRGAATKVINPPGGSANSSSTPRNNDSGDRDGASSGVATSPPNTPNSGVGEQPAAQTAVFESRRSEQDVRITGVPQTELSVASVPGQPSGDTAVLFARLLDVGPDGSRTPLGRSSAAIRVTDLAEDGAASTVDVALSPTVHTLKTGHRLRLRLSTTDAAYSSPEEPAVHRVAPAGRNTISLPSVSAEPVEKTSPPYGALIGIGTFAILIVAGAVLAIRFGRSRGQPPDPELTDVPLAVEGVGKSYPRSPDAVRDLSVRVEPGQIVGLLGPNGAGKTTLLRIVLGLSRAEEGRVRVFGHGITPSAPVLSRVGGVVESPGLLPHLTGLENLRSHWEATGRPLEQARLDEVVRIAALGEFANHKAGTYGPGMRQRVALAQAMLGMPDLLVLDEPMNALDPAHTQRMREVLREYASTGRSVLLSSHLLDEVEKTCTHVVVLREGRRVAGGTTEELIAADSITAFHVDQPERAARTLEGLEGIGKVEIRSDVVYAELAGHPTALAVNALVNSEVSINRVGPHRKLEDAFLELVGEDR